MTAPRVSVRNVSKRFRSRHGDVLALDDVSLEVQDGEVVVLLGPSGCGKTTLLRCIAGLERPDAGEIEIHGEIVFSSERRIFRPPEQRRLSMVFQSYALWPHLSAFENVAYPLRNRRVGGKELEQRVDQVLQLVGCGHLAKRYPGQLSGGQQQRVALARAIVANDGLVLFDEPLSNVDAKVREQLRVELLAMQRELGFAALYVTHDQTEATALAHRIAVMNTGVVAQMGPPREIYERPTSRYVADFIGTANVLDGVVAARDGQYTTVRTPLGDIQVVHVDGDPSRDSPVAVVFRPEHCRLDQSEPTGQPNRWPGLVSQVLYLGFHTEYLFKTGEQLLRVRSMQPLQVSEGDAAWLSVDPAQLWAIPAPPSNSTLMEPHTTSA